MEDDRDNCYQRQDVVDIYHTLKCRQRRVFQVERNGRRAFWLPVQRNEILSYQTMTERTSHCRILALCSGKNAATSCWTPPWAWSQITSKTVSSTCINYTSGDWKTLGFHWSNSFRASRCRVRQNRLLAIDAGEHWYSLVVSLCQ